MPSHFLLWWSPQKFVSAQTSKVDKRCATRGRVKPQSRSVLPNVKDIFSLPSSSTLASSYWRTPWLHSQARRFASQIPSSAKDALECKHDEHLRSKPPNMRSARGPPYHLPASLGNEPRALSPLLESNMLSHFQQAQRDPTRLCRKPRSARKLA